jgi:putative acetyltransferase
MIIRAERAEDVSSINALITAAFTGRPFSSGTEAVIVDAVRAAGALRLSLVAEEEGEIVGQIAFSPVTIEGQDDGWLGLGPVAVAPARQRQGIGTVLIRQGLAVLRAQGAPGCVLLGNPKYYARFGFAHDPRLSYRTVPPPYFQRLAFADALPLGRAEYHAAFDVSGS